MHICTTKSIKVTVYRNTANIKTVTLHGRESILTPLNIQVCPFKDAVSEATIQAIFHLQ